MRVMTSVAMISMLCIVGCGDDASGPPTNKPAILPQGTQALCVEKREQTGKVLVLDQITIAVSDMDGVADIMAPIVEIDGVSLTMSEVVKGPANDPSMNPDSDEECLAEDFVCTGTFTWRRETNPDKAADLGVGKEQILCGPGNDGGNPPVFFDPAPYLEVTIMDAMGWSTETVIIVSK